MRNWLRNLSSQAIRHSYQSQLVTGQASFHSLRVKVIINRHAILGIGVKLKLKKSFCQNFDRLK